MEEDTTITQVDQPITGAEQALPVVTDTPVVTEEPTTTEPSESQPDANVETPSAPQVDDKLKRYAQSQGFELDSPGAIKAAQAGLKAQAEATKNYQKASELEKTASITQEDLPVNATPEQVDNARYRNMEIKMWKLENQDKLGLESEMIKVLSDPTKKALVQEGYLSLDDVYNLAKASAPDNSDAVKSQGKREALESLAHKQNAAVPTGHATTSGTPQEKPFKELSLAEMEAKLGFAPR